MAVLPVLLLLTMMLAQDPAAPSRPDCGDWRDCRQRALDAAAGQQYEAFHDLAWRAVQKGPPQDEALMYMLARAQSLSGRPHDALVMLLRLADRGYTTDAAVNEDFAAVRRLPQWPDLAARLRDMSPPPAPDAAPGEASPSAPIPAPPTPSAIPAPPAPSPRPAGPAAPGGAAAAPRHAAAMPIAPGLRGAEEALRVPALAMTPIALAHDRASGRFVFGGASSRKLVIVDERMHLVVDLVREASAGFYDIAAFEIDPWRGDLWVVSADEKAGATALHHVQMVSGRPLERLDLPNGLMPGRFVDVAVTRDAIVYVLDAAGQRLFSVRQKERALTLAARLDLPGASSIAPAGDGIVYVAHLGGVARVDTRTGHAVAVRLGGVALPAFARIRWAGGALLGVERLDDGTCRIVRVRVEPTTARARSPEVLASGIAIPAASATTVSEDAVYYVSREEGATAGAGDDTVVRRLPLRP